jgi:hypothetical protein
MPWHELPDGGWSWERPDADPVTQILPVIPPLGPVRIPAYVPPAVDVAAEPDLPPTEEYPAPLGPPSFPSLDLPLPYEKRLVAPSTQETPMLSSRFWLSALERALKTAAQTLIAVWPLGENAFGLLDIDWKKSLSIAGLAAALSLLTSLISAPVGPDNSPSLVGEPPKEPDALVGQHAQDGVGRDGQPEMPASLFEKPGATRYDGDQRG